MLQEYRRQSERLKLLRGYKAILILSRHMASEFMKRGFPADSIFTLDPILGNGSSNWELWESMLGGGQVMNVDGQDPVLQGRHPIRISVVIPVLNEAHVLKHSVRRVQEFLSNGFPYLWQIVIADNGSSDGTLEVASELTAETSDVVVLHLQQRGRGRALRHAWSQSSADILCYMDVDLSTDLSALPLALHALIEQHADLAVGSRLLPESKTRRSLQREIISRVYNWIVKLALRTRFSDAQCGFKVVKREVVNHVLSEVKDESWFFDTELLVLAEKLGYHIADIPVIWDEDRDTRVKFLRTAWDDLKGVVRLRKLLGSDAFEAVASEHGKKARVAEQIGLGEREESRTEEPVGASDRGRTGKSRTARWIGAYWSHIGSRFVLGRRIRY